MWSCAAYARESGAFGLVAWSSPFFVSDGWKIQKCVNRNISLCPSLPHSASKKKNMALLSFLL